MKSGWQTKTLGEICRIKPPKSEAREKIAPTDLVSFMPMEDLGINRKDAKPKQSKPLEDLIGSYTYFAEGDILLAKITPCFENGKLGIATDLQNGIGFGSSEYIVFRPDESVSAKWLYYFLSQPSFREEGARHMSGAVGHKRVTKEFIEGTKISVPPLQEQQRIIAILDEAFDGIGKARANAEKNLQNARALFKCHLNAIFSECSNPWKRVRIKDACESIMDCVNKTAPKVDEPTPFKMIRTTNVRNGRINLDSVYYVTEDVYRIWTRRQVPQRGDVILTREAPMGEVGMLESDDNIFLGQRLVSYRTNPAKLNNRFLLYALQSASVQNQIRALASGSTVQHMRVPDSKNLQLLLPALRAQNEIAIQLDSFRAETQHLESLCQRKLAVLDELKKSLLHQAFTGELTEKPEYAVVLPFPTKKPNISTTDLHAGILAIAFDLHEKKGNVKHFGHVKAEKIAHMVESYLNIDLGRAPIKDAAGPNDYPHLKRVEHRAKMAGFFDFRRVKGAGYQVTKDRKFEELIERTRFHLGDRNQDVDRLLMLMLPMATQQAEVFCTVYAAWNNLLLDRQQPSDESIVTEARENWHPDKLKIPREKFFAAIDWMKTTGIIPKGKGKKVSEKE